MNLFTTNDKETLRVIPVAEYWGRVLANARSRGSTRMPSNVSTAQTAPPSSKIVGAYVTDYLSALHIGKQWSGIEIKILGYKFWNPDKQHV
jgi:hypothetical protein